MRHNLKIHLIASVALLAATSLLAQPVQPEHVQAELIAEVTSIRPGEPFWVALRLQMEPHWHTYWRNPGDSGLATSIEWTLPAGFRAGAIRWPHPKRIEPPPLTSYGYEGEVLLLSQITVPTTATVGAKVKIAAQADWLVCKEICLPGSAILAVELPVQDALPASDPRWHRAFAEARARLPIPPAGWQFRATADDSVLSIFATPPDWFHTTLSQVQFFPITSGLLENAAPQVLQKTAAAYQLDLRRLQLTATQPDSVAGVLVAAEGWRGPGSEHAMEIAVPVSVRDTGPAVTAVAPGLRSLGLALVFAFLGGMILNLMPCVLPVLSLKVLAFVKQSGEDRRKIGQHSGLFTAGVLVSFWILAGGLLALRAAGEQLGWGFQLQSPTFLVVLSAILFLFGTSLFGVFEIGTSRIGVGGNLERKTGGGVGAFLSGVAATVVATPCTAPFMGTALGYALTQPVWGALLIFTALGLGMAAPLVALFSVPALLRFVPKPGRWMESFKQFMGFLLMATVVWLVWVLGIQAGLDAVAGLLVAFLFLALAGWIFGRWGTPMLQRRTRFIARALAVSSIGIGIALAISALPDESAVPTPASAATPADGIAWEPFAPERLDALHREGRPVLIDFTAAWCLSCQVNERVAFGDPTVQQRLAELGVVAIKADWTSRSETITRALAAYGRNSVPLYVLYGKDAKRAPTVLPEIITPGIVLEALTNLE